MDAVTMGLVCPARELARETKSNAAFSSRFYPSSGGSIGSIQLGLVTRVSIAGQISVFKYKQTKALVRNKSAKSAG
jgi:hypothetical protein